MMMMMMMMMLWCVLQPQQPTVHYGAGQSPWQQSSQQPAHQSSQPYSTTVHAYQQTPGPGQTGPAPGTAQQPHYKTATDQRQQSMSCMSVM